MAFEDEDHWPANPWQAQADAQLLHLQRSLQELGGSCGVLHRLHDLEGQLAAAEAKIAAQSYELQEARQELELTQRRRPPGPGAEELAALQEKNEFLNALMSRFERKVMLLEEENAKLTIAAAHRCAVVHAATQVEDQALHEVEGQLAMVEGHLRRKEHELQEVKDSLKKEKRNWNSFLSVAKGRTPAQLVSEVETLQSRNGFLSDLVRRFEDKTMVLERQSKELSEEMSVCKKEKEEAQSTAAEELRLSALRQQQLMEEELLRQLAEARSKARKASPEECCPCPVKELTELKELKELNSQLVERLGKERSDHAETKARLDLAQREEETLQLRIKSLSSQLIQLAELNDDMEEQLQRLVA